MPNLSLLIEPRLRVLDANGDPLSGAKLYAYAAGTVTPLDTYSDAAGSTPNANPVVADSGGLFGPIYLSAAAYKFILTTSADVTVWTQDNVWGENFALLFDDTFILRNAADPTKRFRFSAASITAGQTRVITVPDLNDTMVVLTATQTLTNKTLTAPTLNSPSLSGVLAFVMGAARINNAARGAAVASANDLTLGSDGNVFHITGTTQINRISETSWVDGTEITLIFDGSVTVSHGVADSGAFKGLSLAGAANMSATVQDVLKLVLDDIWREVSRTVV